MLTIKNRAGSNLVKRREYSSLGLLQIAGLILVLALLAGCRPSGPRALLEGKRLIDEGQYPQAVQTLKTAAVLLGGTNALAWNYLGMAYQHAGADAEAEWAYQRALALNRDISEIHFNLGCLWLAQDKFDAAKAEFTAYILRRPDAVEGFLKLGTTQLRARELSAAEKSFNEVLRLNPQNPEALNWLGLALLQRGRPGEAVQCFENALKQQPLYRPALLNWAIVSHQYLKDRPLALEKYREYLALKPPPANADALAATVRQLEQELTPPVRPSSTNVVSRPNAGINSPQPSATNVARVGSAPKAEPAFPPNRLAATTNPPKPQSAAHLTRPAATNPPKSDPAVSASRPSATNLAKPAAVAASAPPTNVEVPKPHAEPVPQRTQDVSNTMPPTLASPAEPLVTTSSVPANAASPNVAKRGFLQRINPLNLFREEETKPVRQAPLDSSERPPQPELAKTDTTASELASTSPAEAASKSPSGRYAYKSPPRPSPGLRSDAERSFAQGLRAQKAHRLPEAIQAYRRAARQDPSLYEAHYNLGLVATEAGNLPLALASYEDALATQPTSLDARYNFALALKQANYIADAVDELEKVVGTYPNETRAHLALGNLYAQQMRQPAKARQHYLKVLEVEPRHPQATVIRYWLAEN